MKAQFTKLASADFLEEISRSITKFYAGEEKELRETGAGWSVHSKKDGRQLSTFVVQSGKRYLFCM